MVKFARNFLCTAIVATSLGITTLARAENISATDLTILALEQNSVSQDTGNTSYQNIAQSEMQNIDTPKIQVAILLDSSSSMDGLIEQTRAQIWSVINALSKVTKEGLSPTIEVSLYHYGNDTLPSVEGFSRMLNELTTDLDLISENLFSIITQGGQEYAGWVIDSATKELEWSDDSEDFRVIFIAGNEPFSQGTVNWQKAIDSATSKDVIVHTIYCGGSEESEGSLWATAANQRDGNYFNLNQDREITVVATPYDTEIKRLNWELNQTYIPYGINGHSYLSRQQTQDQNSVNMGLAAASNRAISKASGNYLNPGWDLVDGIANNSIDLNQVDRSRLPAAWQDISTPVLSEKIREMRHTRTEIKTQITELGQKRAEYIARHTSEEDVDETLDNLMISALYKQLEAKNFEIEK